MVDIQSPTAEIRRGKKEEDRKKSLGKNIMACPRAAIKKQNGSSKNVSVSCKSNSKQIQQS